ncbi:hypothetical protein KQI52_05300 [bacterium]|nr:hypothetical protein [bacterium]
MIDRHDLVYHCDSLPEIGNGHLKRGLDVLHALHSRDPGLRLGLCGSFSDGAQRFIDEFLDSEIEVFANPKQFPFAKFTVLDTMHKPGVPGYMDPQKTADVRDSGQLFIIISSALYQQLPVMCDLFIDHLPDVVIAGVAPRRSLYGFAFAPVGAEFFQPVAEDDEDHHGWLVAVIGGGPVQNGPQLLASEVYERALEQFPGFAMVLSPHFPDDQIAELREQFPKLDLLQGLPSLVPLLQNAGAVICTYGNITYEALSCGQAVFLANYLDFQQEYGQMLERKDLIVNLGKFDALKPSKLELLFQPKVRELLSSHARSEFTGPGIEAITDAVLELMEEND